MDHQSSDQTWRGGDGGCQSARARFTVLSPGAYTRWLYVSLSHARPWPFGMVSCSVIMLYTSGVNHATSAALLFRISTAVSEMKMQTG